MNVRVTDRDEQPISDIDADDSDLLFRLSESPAHLLRRAQQFATEIFSDNGLSDGVTQRQCVVLAAIAEREGLSQSDLVTATGIDRSTLADMIARMQKKGHVTREAAEGDARAKSVRLTDDGRAALDAALPSLSSADEAIMECLPRNRRKAFVDLLLLLSAAADERGVSEPKTRDRKEKSGDKKKKKKKKKQAKKS